jgi:hypothetical protein
MAALLVHGLQTSSCLHTLYSSACLSGDTSPKKYTSGACRHAAMSAVSATVNGPYVA